MDRQGRSRVVAIVAAAAVLGCGSTTASARVRVGVSVDTPVVLASGSQLVHLKVSLAGAPIEADAPRTPVNVAIVLDRSGSMSGEKLAKAKEAAILAIDRLGPDDIVSVVAYNHLVTVLVPATRLGDRAEVLRQVDRLFASGTTALFAGVRRARSRSASSWT